MSQVLLVTSGFKHPPLRGIMNLRKFLKEIRYIKLSHEGRLTEESAALFAAYDAVIFYFHKPDQILSEKTEKALKKYVKRGGGLLVIHSATASFSESETYYSLIGGRYLSRSPVVEYSIAPSADADKAFSDFPVFSIRDELYRHEFKDDIKVQMSVDNGEDKIPVVWTRKQGDGRVCCICPGHCEATLKNFEIKRLLSSALTHILKRD